MAKLVLLQCHQALIALQFWSCPFTPYAQSERKNMRMEGRRESDNVEDIRASGGSRMMIGGGGGLMTLVILLLPGTSNSTRARSCRICRKAVRHRSKKPNRSIQPTILKPN